MSDMDIGSSWSELSPPMKLLTVGSLLAVVGAVYFIYVQLTPTAKIKYTPTGEIESTTEYDLSSMDDNAKKAMRAVKLHAGQGAAKKNP